MDDSSQTDRPAASAIADPDAPDRPPSAGPAMDLAGAAAPDALTPLIDRLARALAPRTGEVRVRVVHDDEMAAAHERYKNVPGTTDVLTFDLADDSAENSAHDPAAPLDVDLLVCIDEARRQADTRGIPVEHELLLYITHGILHCSGYNDDTPANADAMHAREDELLSAAGVGPVYAKGDPSATEQAE